MTHKLPPKTVSDEERYKKTVRYLDVIEHIYDSFKDTDEYDRNMDREDARELTHKENLLCDYNTMTAVTPSVLDKFPEWLGATNWSQRTQNVSGEHMDTPVFSTWEDNKYTDALETIHVILCEQTDGAVTIEGEWYDSEFIPGPDYRTKLTASNPDSHGAIQTTLAIELNTNGILTVKLTTQNSADLTTVKEFEIEDWPDVNQSVLKDRLWCQVIAGAYANEIFKGTTLSKQESMALVLNRAGYSDEEIGRLMKVYRSTVGTYLQRARQKREDAVVEIERLKKTIDVVDNLSEGDLEESSI